MFNVQFLFPIAKIYKGLSSDDRAQGYLGPDVRENERILRLNSNLGQQDICLNSLGSLCIWQCFCLWRALSSVVPRVWFGKQRIFIKFSGPITKVGILVTFIDMMS